MVRRGEGPDGERSGGEKRGSAVTGGGSEKRVR